MRVTDRTGRPGSFEVFVDGQLLHSKLQCESFPAAGELARVVNAYAFTGRLEKKEPGCCVVQ